MILLHSIIPEKNRYRRYTMDLQLSLFGGVYLTTSWGRINGTNQQKRDYWFDDESDALKKARSVIKARIRHDYHVIKEGPLYEKINGGISSTGSLKNYRDASQRRI